MATEKKLIACPTCNGSGVIEQVLTTSNSHTNRPIAQKLRKQGMTMREIANHLGYKSPGSVLHLLKPRKKKK